MAEDISRDDLRAARKATRQALAEWRRDLWARQDCTDGDKLIGTIMCDEYFNIDNAQLNPSLPSMAVKSGRSVRGAKKSVDKLKMAAIVGWQSGRGRTSSRYILYDGTGTPIPGSMERLGLTKRSETGTTVPDNSESTNQTGAAIPGRLEHLSCLSGTPVPPNLLKNLEKNLVGLEIYERLKSQLGRTKEWVWKDAVIGPAGEIVFARAGCHSVANDLHGRIFDDAKIVTTSRDKVAA